MRRVSRIVASGLSGVAIGMFAGRRAWESPVQPSARIGCCEPPRLRPARRVAGAVWRRCSVMRNRRRMRQSRHAGSRGVPSGGLDDLFQERPAMRRGRPRLCGLVSGPSVSPRSRVAECVGRALVLSALEKRVPILRLRPRLEVVKGDVRAAERRAIEREGSSPHVQEPAYRHHRRLQ
jgi:hypothetical protein